MWLSAAEVIHLHHGLETPQIELRLPTLPVETGEVRLRKLAGIQQRGDHDQHLGTKPTLWHVDADLPEEDVVGKSGVRLSIQPLRAGGLLPRHHVIASSQTMPRPKVGPAEVVFPEDGINASLRQQDYVKPPTEISIS
jgi:hypothetical protein